MFIVYSVGCSMFFGVHNYCIAVAMHKYRNSPTILFPEFIAFVIIYVLYHWKQASQYVKPRTGSYWNKSNSVFFTADGSLRLLTFVIVLLRAIAADIIPINVSLTTYFCKLIGISPAVINSFSTMSSFTTALLFFILYKERLNRQHVVGMLLILASVGIVAIFKTLQMNSTDESDVYLTALDEDDEISGEKLQIPEEKNSPWMILVPIGIVNFSIFLLTLGSWTSRAARSVKYAPNQFVADFCMTAAIFYFFGFLYVHFFSGTPYTVVELVLMVLAGFIIEAAFLCLNAAVISGKGALAMAISQTQSFFWLFFELVISFRIPYLFEIVAMGVGLSGATVIALAKR